MIAKHAKKSNPDKENQKPTHQFVFCFVPPEYLYANLFLSNKTESSVSSLKIISLFTSQSKRKYLSRSQFLKIILPPDKKSHVNFLALLAAAFSHLFWVFNSGVSMFFTRTDILRQNIGKLQGKFTLKVSPS